jgi:hypothetical protein
MATKKAYLIEKSVNMEVWLARKGLTDDVLADKIKDGMEATRVIPVFDRDNPTAPPRKIEVPDWQSRHRYLDTALEISGKKPKGGVTINNQLTQVQIDNRHFTNPEDIAFQEEMRLRLKERLGL